MIEIVQDDNDVISYLAHYCESVVRRIYEKQYEQRSCRYIKKSQTLVR